MKTIRILVIAAISAFAATAASAQSVTPEATEEPILPGSSWLLTATSGQDHQTLVLPGSSVTLTFEEEDHISGNGGCNGYSGVYTLGEEDEIALSEIVSTLMACEDTQLTTQESIYLGALGSVTHYDLTERQLTLRIEDLENLHFVRVDEDPLAGTSWVLINEVPAAVEATPEVEATAEVGGMARPITLIFPTEGQAGGHGGCNSYSTSYTLDGIAITFSDIVSTMMACEEGGIMQREQEFLAALSGATQYGLTDERLYIRPEAGSRLAFEKVDAATLTAAPVSGAAGTEIELTGSGFAANSAIVIGFGPFDGDVYEPVGEVESDADGAFTATVSVPATADPNVDYVFMAAVPGTARTLSEPFDVTDG